MSPEIARPLLNRSVILGRAIILAAMAGLAESLPAAASTITLFSSQVDISVNAAGGVEPSVGISKTTTGSGPISDSELSTLGLGFASGAGSVDSTGLHASSAVHADVTNGGYAAAATSRSSWSIPSCLLPTPDSWGRRCSCRFLTS